MLNTGGSQGPGKEHEAAVEEPNMAQRAQTAFDSVTFWYSFWKGPVEREGTRRSHCPKRHLEGPCREVRGFCAFPFVQ